MADLSYEMSDPTCPDCGRGFRSPRRFCGGCRALLIRACAACGYDNERDDVWCGGCARALPPVAARGKDAAGVAHSATSTIPVLVEPPTPAPPPVAANGPLVSRLVAKARSRTSALPEDLADQAAVDALFGDRK